MPRFPFPDDPTGWYCVGPSSALAPGSLQPRTLFGEPTVLLRTRAGEPALLHAICPHMGADLREGGHVQHDELRCPFHAFGFDRHGHCVSTPYGQGAPPAKLRSWPVIDHHGFLFAWHDPLERAPWFELPELPVEGWAGPWTCTWDVRSHPQETTENSVDIGHFKVIHGYSDVEELAPLQADGPVLRTRYAFSRKADFLGRAGEVRTHFTATITGLGYSMVQPEILKPDLGFVLLVLPTPTESGRCELRIVVWARPYSSPRRLSEPLTCMPRPLVTRMAGWATFKGIQHDVNQDISIWENKRYLHPPRLARGDGPIVRYRTWCRQFYERGEVPAQAP